MMIGNKAVVEFEQVAAAAEQELGENWLTAFSAVHYGQCLASAARYEQAEAVLLAVHGSGDESSTEAIIDLYVAWGRPDKAAEYRGN